MYTEFDLPHANIPKVDDFVFPPVIVPELPSVKPLFEMKPVPNIHTIERKKSQVTQVSSNYQPYPSPVKKQSALSHVDDFKFQPLLSEESKAVEGLICEICHKNQPDMSEMFFPECCHMMCKDHATRRVLKKYPKSDKISCPKKGCKYLMCKEEIENLVSPSDLEKLRDDGLKEFIGENAIIFECSCGTTSIVDPGAVDYSYKDENGKQVSREAAEHMARYRIRCGSCHRITCSKCKSEPYHLGKNCEEFQNFKKSKKCKYCQVVVTSSRSVCKDNVCRARYRNACRKVHQCGHQCYGVKHEAECLPCVADGCNPTISENDYCTICYTEGLGSAPCVMLECGHVLHYHCLLTSIEKR